MVYSAANITKIFLLKVIIGFWAHHRPFVQNITFFILLGRFSEISELLIPPGYGAVITLLSKLEGINNFR